jgi:hypothetical protein
VSDARPASDDVQQRSGHPVLGVGVAERRGDQFGMIGEQSSIV